MGISEEWYRSDLSYKEDVEKQPADTKRYRRLLKYSITTTIFVAITPLIIMAVINFYQYRKAYKADIIYPIARQTSNIRRSLIAFINERRSALKLIISEKNYAELSDTEELASTFRHLKEAFDGFVDISLINSDGDQVAYFGPYNLKGKNYKNQDWFHEVSIKGSYVSDVFMGFRDMPHFVIAIVHEHRNGNAYVLRATVDSDVLHQKILSHNILLSSDAFLIDRNGILQTPSKYQGPLLEKTAVEIPPYSEHTEVIECKQKGSDLIVGYAYITGTPFILIETTNPASIMSNWASARNDLIVLVSLCVILMVIVIIWISRRMVSQIRLSDMKRMKILREISYTNKMASIGRLAAGVSHEINNPLAIIGENAGIVHDIMSINDEFPYKDKINKHLNSIINSVDRCSKITHRLLGFAKRMDTQIEVINLPSLLEEVISFNQREAKNRHITIDLHEQGPLDNIESDRGQLQQVFLNILNNALDAVADGDRIEIYLEKPVPNRIAVSIKDSGPGIPKSDLERIFEPFYTTKKDTGTGLGLSITYGIVTKLGGSMKVKSKLGEGTTFIVELPMASPQL